MITTKTNLAFELVANKLNLLHGRDGDLSGLTTTEKATFVAAINELHALINSTGAAAVVLDDSAESATTVYSSSKTKAVITADIAAALEGEDLSDLAASVVALAAADNDLVSAAGLQTFSAAQQLQARQNIGAASQADLDTNIAGLAATVAATAANTGAINTNTSDIGANTTGLAATVAATTTNATDIATNGSAITNNTAAIAANGAAIGSESEYDPVATVNGILTF